MTAQRATPQNPSAKSAASPRSARAGTWLILAPFRADTWVWAWFCLAGLVVGIVALTAGFCGLLAASFLVLTLVGIPVVLVLLGSLRMFANLERRRLGWTGTVVASPYPADAPHRSWLGRLADRAREPAAFRDLAWLLLSGPVGIAAGLAAAVSWLTAAAATTLPVWYRWLPAHHAVLISGPHEQRFVIGSAGAALPYAAAGIALIWVSAWLTVGLGRAEALLMRALLAGSPRLRLSGAVAARQAAVRSQQQLVERLARDLHDGAQARLVTAALDLNLALHAQSEGERERLMRQAQASSQGALAELRDLVNGIAPPLLRERGLVGALDGLALEAPQPVSISADINGELPGAVALAAYFIIAEALTNVAKHSDARAVQIVLHERADVLHLLVTDDGRGGADPAGMGLRGLADRATAAGGVMMVSSPPGGPTRIEARLPCE